MIRYKGYIISSSKLLPGLVGVATEGKGGKIPNILSGGFTSTGVAKKEIDRYLESKVKTDAKATSESGGQ